MENPYIKYLKTMENETLVFYTENNTLLMFEYKPLYSCPFQIIADNITGKFSVCHYQGTTYVTYYKNDGNLYVCTTKNNIDFTHTLCMVQPPNFPLGKVTLIPTDETCYMIYHTPSQYNNIENLVYSQYIDGIWQAQKIIDQMIIGNINNLNPYFTRRLSDEHLILYYMTSKNLWSSKELLISTNTQGNRKTLIQSNSSFVDISIVNTQEKIHVLYIIKNMFKTQVVYQYRQTDAVSPPRVIWESSYCQHCLAYLQGSKLTLMWRINQVLMECISYDEGATFQPVARYKDFYPNKCDKCEFYSYGENHINTTAIYSNSSKGNLPFMPI